MRRSIKRKIAFAFIGLTVLTLALIGLLHYALLPSYYTTQKEKILEESREIVNGMNDLSEMITEDEFRIFYTNNNLDWVVTDGSMSILAANMRENDAKRLIVRIFGYAVMQDDTYCQSLKRTSQYEIQKIKDPNQGVYYLELWGYLDNGGYYLVRTPFESIQEAATISSQFYLIVGVVVLALGGVLIWLMTREITKPIRELTGISKRMACLDFNARYESGGEDEIGELGNNFNIMSSRLEQAISELKAANVELENDIREKTQIDEMRKEFLSNVTHELKTPIALIQGYAEGLKDCVNDDAESREFYCDVIIDESAKMNNMVKQLLNLNQLEFGNDQVKMERFDLAELIDGVLQSSKLMIEQKEARVLWNAPRPLMVWGDEFKVEEVVTNYLTNALNHLEGERTIEITCEEQGGEVKTTVFNTGMPIPEEDIDKIWIKFYKVDKARTREYGGSGIGLSIVKAILDSMNQRCGAVNYENGVAFWFTLDCRGEIPMLEHPDHGRRAEGEAREK